MNWTAWLVFLAAAILEVGGDAAMRKGLHGRAALFIVAGFLMLGSYGLMVNLVRWDFSKLIGAYVAIFALISVLWGKFLLKESVPLSTWVGVAIIAIGGLVIQLGR